MLELNNVEVLYSDVILAVKGITATVPAGQCVTLLGANGAGKSTPPQRGSEKGGAGFKGET